MLGGNGFGVAHAVGLGYVVEVEIEIQEESMVRSRCTEGRHIGRQRGRSTINSILLGGRARDWSRAAQSAGEWVFYGVVALDVRVGGDSRPERY